MPIDTDRTLEIAGSPRKLAGLTLLGLFMTGLGAALAFDLLPDARSGLLGVVAGWFGMLFFGAATLVIVWRMATSARTLVTLTPTGIRDVRVAAEEIPWPAIQRISTWSYQRQRTMVLAVAPEVEARLALTTTARWTRKANAALGADGLCISAQGLTVGFDDLYTTTLAYAAAHGAASAAS